MEEVQRQVKYAAQELLEAANLKSGQVLAVGCSTSEVMGRHIGTAGSFEVASEILAALQSVFLPKGIQLALQCCEHLNRALVVERKVMESYDLEQVCVIPKPRAGGSLAAAAMHGLLDPVVVEKIAAHAGLDIGATLIGMHLRPVAVPVRLTTGKIGQAFLIAARTRPKYIGGARAAYE